MKIVRSYLLLVLFVLSSFWFRGVSYSHAVVSNNYRQYEKVSKISSQYYEECPEIPFVFIPSYSFFNFVATEELFGLPFVEKLANSLDVLSYPLFFKRGFVDKITISPPIYIQVQSIRC